MTGHFQTHCTHRVQSCTGVAELETRLLPASTLHKTSPLSTEYTAKVEGNMFIIQTYNLNTYLYVAQSYIVKFIYCFTETNSQNCFIIGDMFVLNRSTPFHYTLQFMAE